MRNRFDLHMDRASFADELEEPLTPPCVLCAPRGSQPRAPRHLAHGVTVWLCATHGSDLFLRRKGGRVFAERLAAAWAAAGAMGARRADALRTHLRQQQRPLHPRVRPGSYSWPRLRAEAERRFAAGEPPQRVIDELRRRHARAVAVVPSQRTMRRWFTEARWLTSTVPFPDMRTGRRDRPVRPPRRLRPLPPGFNTRPFFPWDQVWEHWRNRR